MLFKKDEWRLLWPFYVFAFVFGITAMIIPFAAIFYRELGFSFFQIGLLAAASSITVFLFEIPTGAFADKKSRKHSVLLGLFLAGIGALAIGFASNFYIILLAWILTGIGMTFISGAQEAWVIDNLHAYKREDLIQEFYMKYSSIASIGFVFAPIMGGIIVKNFSIRPLWSIFALGIFIGMGTLLFLEEKYVPKKREGTESEGAVSRYAKQGYEGMKFTLTHPVVFILVVGAILCTMVGVSSDFWQPMLTGLGMPAYALGLMFSAFAVVNIFVPFTSKFFSKWDVKRMLIFTTIIDVALHFIIFLLFPPFYIFAAIIYVTTGGFSSATKPVLNTYLNKFIPSRMRATVLSSKSMLSSLALAILALVAGALMDVYGPQKIIAFSAVFGVFAIILYMRLRSAGSSTVKQ